VTGVFPIFGAVRGPVVVLAGEGGQGRPKAARRGSLDGPVMVIDTMG
jgi:hypothetical protein